MLQKLDKELLGTLGIYVSTVISAVLTRNWPRALYASTPEAGRIPLDGEYGRVGLGFKPSTKTKRNLPC